MRNPLRKAGVFLGIGLAGSVLVWLSTLAHAARGESSESILPLVSGVVLGLVGFSFLLQSLFYVLGSAKLRAGRHVIARWHIDAGDWDRFREFDRARSRESAALVNDLWIRKDTPRSGVEVIVGRTSLLVDGSYHVLRPGGQPEVRGVQLRTQPGGLPFVEFEIAYVNRYGVATTRLVLRVPFPDQARQQAQRVLAHFQGVTRPRTALALRNPRRTIVVCLVVAGLAASAAAAGFAMNANGHDGNLPALLGVGGTLVGLAALLLVGLVAILRVKPPH